jgi:hypothetical protein
MRTVTTASQFIEQVKEAAAVFTTGEDRITVGYFAADLVARIAEERLNFDITAEEAYQEIMTACGHSRSEAPV